MGRQRPASVTHAIRVQVALLVASGLTTLLAVVQRESLVESWALRQPPGTQPPAVAPVAVVLYVTFALLVAVLVMFFREGHPSARLALTGVAALFLFAMVVVQRLDPPVVYVVLAAVCALLDLLLLALLWRRDTSAFVRGSAAAPRGSSAF